MPVTAEDYWTSYELGTARNLVDAVRLAKRAASEDLANWVWRGQADAAWGLHGSLSRSLKATSGHWPDERELVAAEGRLFESAERWGLGWTSRGRVSALELFALVRHHGAPSRFIDVSASLAVALHNACAPTRDADDCDARVFAFDGEGQALTDHISDLETGPLNREPSWWTSPPEWWITSYTVWRPPAIDDRIVRQQGAFLISGVPTTTVNQKWYLQGRGPGSGSRYRNPLTAAEVLGVTSVGVRCHSAAGRGARPEHPVRTFRIAAGAKTQILAELRALFGLSAAGIYPDAAGFVQFGVPQILA
jgi:hypothetical protein